MIAAHDKHSLVAIYVQPTDRIDIQTRQYNKTPRAASATLTILLLCVFVCDLVIYVRRAASSYIYVYGGVQTVALSIVVTVTTATRMFRLLTYGIVL